MSNIDVFTILSMFIGLCVSMLDQGIPTTPKLPSSEAAYLHQILNQESAMRIELEKQIASLHSTVYSMQQELLGVKTENQVLKGDVSLIQQNLSKLKLQNQVLVGNMTGTNSRPDNVMFSVYLSSNINNPHVDQVIILDKAWTNTNNAYNTGSGIFTAPVSGFYHFSITICTAVVNTHLRLMYNGRSIASIIGDIHHTGYYGRGTLTLIYHMKAGDNIWIASTDNNAKNIILGSNPPLTVFTGHVIQRD